MRTGFRRCLSRDSRPAQAIRAGSRDSGKLPPWLKDAQDNAVVGRLRRNLEARGDKPYLGNISGRAPSLVQRTSEDPEATSTPKCRAHRWTATENTLDSLSEIDSEDINDLTVGKNEIAACLADRLRMELSEVKDQLDKAEEVNAKLADELLSSKRELNAARDVEQQMSMQIDVLVNKFEGSATAVENAAKREENSLATLHSELEVMKSELAGKISELNEMKPQLDLARMQLRIFQETCASSPGQVKTAEMLAEQAGEELAVKAEFGAMNKIDVNQSTELLPANPGQLLKELNNEHSQADHISKLEAELESAQNAQTVMQDAWWMMQEPSYNMFSAESQNVAAEVLAQGSEVAIASSSHQALRNGDTCVWKVFNRSGVSIRVAKCMKAAITGSKDAGMVVCGHQEHGWVALTEEPGFMKISQSGRILMRKLHQSVMICP